MLKCVIALLASALLVGCQGRPRTTRATAADAPADRSERHLGEIDLRGGAPETPHASLLDTGAHRAFADLVLALRQMKDEPHLEAVFVRLGTSEIALARAEEIGAALAAIRASGRPVTCHADGYTNGSIWLAAEGCDQIWLSPAGTVDTVGLAAQLLFGRSVLDKLNVRVDFLQAGKYKGASEPFERDSASPEALSSLRAALGDLRAAWLDELEKSRGKDHQLLGLEDGPHTPAAAKRLGLIDEIGFEQQALAHARGKLDTTATVPYFGRTQSDSHPVAELLRLVTGTSSMSAPHVAIVIAAGGITLHGGSSVLPTGQGIQQRTLSRLLHRLENDEDVKAVVLRIDSPGGSALASDLLWHDLMSLRKAKPLIVSLGAMAASGGYYLASAGSKIVTDRATIVGSIGVVAGKLSFAESLAQIGVHVEAVSAPGQSATRALYGSPLAAWDDATRSKVREAVMATYQLFIARVAEGRKLPASRIEAVAEGRIMGGDRALLTGLADESGGLMRAIDLALDLAGSDEQLAVQIMRPPSALMNLLGIDAAEPAAANAQLQQQLNQASLLAMSRAWLPLRDEVSAFAASIDPLLGGERFIAALPYALVLH